EARQGEARAGGGGRAFAAGAAALRPAEGGRRGDLHLRTGHGRDAAERGADAGGDGEGGSARVAGGAGRHRRLGQGQGQDVAAAGRAWAEGGGPAGRAGAAGGGGVAVRGLLVRGRRG